MCIVFWAISDWAELTSHKHIPLLLRLMGGCSLQHVHDFCTQQTNKQTHMHYYIIYISVIIDAFVYLFSALVVRQKTTNK